MSNQPRLSVIVRVVGGGKFLGRCLRHLTRQTNSRGAEIIVPFDATVEEIDDLKCEFPDVKFVPTPNALNAKARTCGEAHELYDMRSATGFGAASGNVFAHIEDYAIPDEDWCEQILSAHEHLPHGVIGGAVEHANPGALNWAIYWLDFARYELPLDEGCVAYLSDVNVSYKRNTLDAIRDLWIERYNEFTIHTALAREGTTLWLRPQIVVRQDRGKLSLRPIIAERFYWGRFFAQMRVRAISRGARIGYALASPLLPFVMTARIARQVLPDSRYRLNFIFLSPMIFVLACFWCLGEFAGYLTGQS